MNRIIGILIFTLYIGNVFAQDINQSNIPAVVLNAFQLKYPNAYDVKWKLKERNYYIEYEVNGKSQKIKMDYKGIILKHSQDLYDSEVPKIVQEAIATKVDYFDIHDADKYEVLDKITYEIRFKKDGKNHYFWINEKGELLKYRKELKDSEIPLAIINFIKDSYSSLDIERAKFVEEGGTINYIIGGEINDVYHVFWFDRKANLLKHKQDISKTKIPIPVLDAAKQAYNGYDIRDADLIEEGGKTTYTLKMRKSKDDVYITFSSKGKILEEK